ncbi:MAG TPA: hypothetical protein VGH05_10750 [Buttiauxella sp.]|jgi:hypothetical protein
MNRSEDEKLTDVLIGQAILSLLYENGPINTQALIARLKIMESCEAKADKRAAISGAIVDISTGSLAARHRLAGESEVSDRERRGSGNNVYPLFGDTQQSGNGKKH